MNKKELGTELEEFNRQSLIKFKKASPRVIKTNPGFFDDEVMSQYGYQEFSVVKVNDREYLTVDRTIVHNERRVDLNTSVYELDENNTITKLSGSIPKRIRTITPDKKN